MDKKMIANELVDIAKKLSFLNSARPQWSEIGVDKKMDNETYKLRKMVMNYIYRAKGIYEKILNKPCPRVTVRIVNLTPECIKKGVAGYAIMGGNKVSIPDSSLMYPDEIIHEIVFHELVHATLGIGHEESNRLMSSVIDGKMTHNQVDEFYADYVKRQTTGRHAKNLTANYYEWRDLKSDVKTDIIENIYHSSKYLEDEWNIWTFKEYIDDDSNPPRFKIVYPSVDELYKEMQRRGWGLSEKQVANLVNILKSGQELDPVMLKDGVFYDGGHRLTAYKKLGKKNIPAIDIGPLLKTDWKKYMEG